MKKIILFSCFVLVAGLFSNGCKQDSPVSAGTPTGGTLQHVMDRPTSNTILVIVKDQYSGQYLGGVTVTDENTPWTATTGNDGQAIVYGEGGDNISVSKPYYKSVVVFVPNQSKGDDGVLGQLTVTVSLNYYIAPQ